MHAAMTTNLLEEALPWADFSSNIGARVAFRKPAGDWPKIMSMEMCDEIDS